jgi:hypothetical protein
MAAVFFFLLFFIGTIILLFVIVAFPLFRYATLAIIAGGAAIVFFAIEQDKVNHAAYQKLVQARLEQDRQRVRQKQDELRGAMSLIPLSDVAITYTNTLTHSGKTRPDAWGRLAWVNDWVLLNGTIINRNARHDLTSFGIRLTVRNCAFVENGQCLIVARESRSITTDCPPGEGRSWEINIPFGAALPADTSRLTFEVNLVSTLGRIHPGAEAEADAKLTSAEFVAKYTRLGKRNDGKIDVGADCWMLKTMSC